MGAVRMRRSAKTQGLCAVVTSEDREGDATVRSAAHARVRGVESPTQNGG